LKYNKNAKMARVPRCLGDGKESGRPWKRKWPPKQRSGSPLPGTGRHMMPWLACAFLRAAHGHAKALRTWPLRLRMRARQARGVAEDASARAMTAGLAFPIVYPPARGRARTAECPWHFQDELKDKI